MIILETAVRDGKLMQDLELESLCNGVGHSQRVLDHPIANDSGSRDCVKLPSPTAVSRIIYVYSKCSTCKQAISFLEQKNISFIRKEITLTPPTKSELQTMLGYYHGKINKLFNTSGILYREMNLTEKLKSMDLNEALSLLTQHGMLIKRPFLLGDGFGFTGFNASEWAKKI